MTHQAPSLFDWKIAGPAIGGAFRKLDPRLMVKNPVMFVTLVGAVLTTIGIFTYKTDRGFIAQLALWLWFTVLFANFAEAVAEGRGKAQAQALRGTRVKTSAHRLTHNGHPDEVSATDLRKGDIVLVRAGEIIPADGDVIEGAATVDESAITGESAPVIRECGGDRIYAAWRLTYLEPFFQQIAPRLATHQQWTPGLCPNAETIQPELVQLKTNYLDLQVAAQKADALRKTIRFFEGRSGRRLLKGCPASTTDG